MTITRERIIEILKKVNHPGSGKDIVSSGMISDIVINRDTIDIALSTGARKDPFARSVKRACEKFLFAEFGNAVEINIEIITDIPKPQVHKEILPGVKNIIAIASGKGGVGKSTIAVNLAVSLARKGYATGLCDADIYGPSVPVMLGCNDTRPVMREENNRHIIIPAEKYGIKFLSIGLFVPAENALVWRGPMATGALRQLISDADWGELDYLLVDLPPGTSDIHLTLVQEVAVTGAVIVSTPQEVALADAIKGVAMFRGEDINVPVLGLVENMAWFTPAELPDNKYYIFGKDGCKNLANKLGLPVLAEIPIVQGIREGGDSGLPVAVDEPVTGGAFSHLADELVKSVELRNQTMEPTKRVIVKNK
jgi:ATP-binding protein involved in chromosome partitioning